MLFSIVEKPLVDGIHSVGMGNGERRFHTTQPLFDLVHISPILGTDGAMRQTPTIRSDYPEWMDFKGDVVNKTLKYSILVFIAGSSYGFIVPIVKNAGAMGIYPHTFLPLQYLTAFLICLVVVLVKRVRLRFPKQLASLALLGFFTGGTSICYYTAVALLPAPAALTLLFQYIWVSVLIECLHQRKLPARSTVVAIIIVLIGTVFATGILDGGAENLDPVGVGFGCFSAIFYALFLYCSGRVATTQPTVVRTMMLAVGGAIITSIYSPSAYTTALFDASTWSYTILLAFMGILLPTTLINYASPRLTAGMVSIMASSELPVGILSAWIIVGDQPSALVLLGAALVFVGMIVKQAPTLAKNH